MTGFASFGVNTRWPELPLSEVNPSQMEHSPICKSVQAALPVDSHCSAISLKNIYILNYFHYKKI